MSNCPKSDETTGQLDVPVPASQSEYIQSDVVKEKRGREEKKCTSWLAEIILCSPYSNGTRHKIVENSRRILISNTSRKISILHTIRLTRTAFTQDGGLRRIQIMKLIECFVIRMGKSLNVQIQMQQSCILLSFVCSHCAKPLTRGCMVDEKKTASMGRHRASF